jgi:hypothetical protein
MHFEIFNLKLGQFHANPYFIQNCGTENSSKLILAR